MEYEWFYLIRGKDHGPVSSAELRKLVSQGIIGPDDLLWRDPFPNWVQGRQIKGLFDHLNILRISHEDLPPNPPPRTAKPHAERIFNDGKFCSICGEKIHHLAEICPHCGVRQASATAIKALTRETSESDRQLLPAIILWVFLGFVGAHAFYCGSIAKGVIYVILFLFGIPFIGLLGFPFWWANFVMGCIDLIYLVTGKYKDDHGHKITQWVPR